MRALKERKNLLFIGNTMIVAGIVAAATLAFCSSEKSRTPLSPLARAEMKIARAEHEKIAADAQALYAQIKKLADEATAPKLAMIKSICANAGVKFDDYASGKVLIDLETGVITDAKPEAPPVARPTEAPAAKK